MSTTIDDSTKVGLKLVLSGVGITLTLVSPMLYFAFDASRQVSTLAESMKAIKESSARTEHNTGATAAALQALGTRYEGESARFDGRLSVVERTAADNAARIRELEQRR